MKVYTYSEARQRLSEVLDIALKEEVIVKRRSGTFSIIYKKNRKSALDVPGIKLKVSTKNILDAVKESRSGMKE